MVIDLLLFIMGCILIIINQKFEGFLHYFLFGRFSLTIQRFFVLKLLSERDFQRFPFNLSRRKTIFSPFISFELNRIHTSFMNPCGVIFSIWFSFLLSRHHCYWDDCQVSLSISCSTYIQLKYGHKFSLFRHPTKLNMYTNISSPPPLYIHL